MPHKDSELVPSLARIIVRQSGTYRFYCPQDKRENKREMLRRYALGSGSGKKIVTRTADDTMWVTVR